MNAIEFDRLRARLAHPGSLVTDPKRFEPYTHDATEFRRPPAAVLLAEDKADVIETVRFCREASIPITPRGTGTGLSGGCVPSEGALVVSTEPMDSLKIRAAERLAVCGPGVITKTLQDEAARYGLTYPPDPASYAECTLAGNVAEGAGGLRCKRFGVTKDYILGLEAVTADGLLLKTGCLNDYRGFSIGDLLVASEGTLAIVTSIVVRLTDLPGVGHTILAAFDDPGHAARTVAAITGSGMIPTVLEYVDGETVELANRYEKTEGLDRAEAVILVETSDRDPDVQAAEVDRICREHSCSYLRTASDVRDAEKLWQIRRNVSKAITDAAGARVSEDVAVPNSGFPALVEFVAAMNRAEPFKICCFGHAGDGNLHVNLLAEEAGEEALERLEPAVERLMEKTLELGGTLSGEHGIGLAKRKYLAREFDAATLGAMLAIKETLDPGDLFNPEKLFDRTP
jgi:glycolate oxidase subunit GlcD